MSVQKTGFYGGGSHPSPISRPTGRIMTLADLQTSENAQLTRITEQIEQLRKEREEEAKTAETRSHETSKETEELRAEVRAIRTDFKDMRLEMDKATTKMEQAVAESNEVLREFDCSKADREARLKSSWFGFIANTTGATIDWLVKKLEV